MSLRVFLGIVFLPFALHAQVLVGSLAPKNRPTDFVYKVSRANKPLKLLFQNESEYELLFVDSTFRSSKSKSYTQVDKKNRFVTSTESDSLLSLYFVNIKSGQFSVLTLSEDSNFIWKDLFQETEKEHFLKAIPSGDKIYALSVDETTSNLIVKKYQGTRQLEIDTFKIEFPLFLEALKSDVNLLNQEPFSDMGITYVDYEVDQDLSDIYTDRKLYLRDDKMIMVFDKANTSHLVIIDLVKKKSYYKKFSFKLELETSEKSNTGNSFLFKDYFFRVTTNGHQLNLAVVDFRNFKLIRNHNIYDDQAIEIKNGPLLLEEITNGSVPKISMIKNVDKFFKMIRGADLGVTAREMQNGTLDLMIGSHMTEVYVSPVMGPSMSMGMGMGMGIGMGGFGMGTPGLGSGMYDPFYYPYGMSSRGYTVSIDKAYFHTILTEKEFAHVPMPLESSYLDKKKVFWSKNFKSGRVPEIDVEYRWNEKMHYGYWDRKMARFVIVEFNR